MDLQDQGVIDSGCSRHMTGNMSYLTDFEEIDGGYVAFGGNPKGGKITGRARTPQQNRVAERKNRTLIEAARTMLADSKLPTTFWAEAVNTACYVQNRVLVIKPHNKTPYELFLGRKPALGFMRPFGCPVTILNTIDHLGKFDGKADEGFFVGYSINSKAFRVFNSRTRIVEENLHVQFSENTPNIAGSGPNWLFDIDALTKSMNYKPVVAGNQSNGNAGTKACDDAGKARMETVPGKDYILLPLWPADPLLSQSSKSSPDAGFKPSGDNEKKVTKEPGKEGGDSNNDQEKEDDNVNNTNNVNTTSDGKNHNNVNVVSSTVNAAGIKVNVVGAKTSIELPDDPNMPELEDIVYSDDAEDVGAEADMNNLNTFMPVSPIPTTRIHKDHPVEQIIEDLNLAPQTRRMTKNLKEHGLFSSVQQRTNHKDFQNCLFACFLSQEEPKKVIHALKDPSWIEAIQDELLPNVKRAIGTKWVFRNKKDESGIVIKNKARIEAIRLFLAYDSFKDFMVYQMDVKSVFLYGKIEEEVYVYQPPRFEDPDFLNRIYKVEKALYSLHQAPRAWYETLLTYLLDNGFQRGKIDKTLFIRRDKEFQMSSMGELTFFLGTASKQGDRIFIRSSKYLKGQPKLGLWYPKDSPFDLVAYTDSDYARASLDRKSTIGGIGVNAGDSKLMLLGINLLLLGKVNDARHNLLLLVFWSTVKAKTVNGEVQLQALVDGKKIVVTEASVRRDLQLEDTDGIDCLPNATIFEQLTLLGAKTTAWNKFSSTMASAIICLATNQKFNFSKYIFESMVKNLDSAGKFLMYPRFVQVFLDNQLEGMINHNRIYIAPSHTKKVFANMKRQGKDFSGRVTPLFSTMMVQAQQEQGEGVNTPRSGEDSLQLKELMLYKVGLPARIDSSNDEASLGDQEDASKQGRKIHDIDSDEDITLENSTIPKAVTIAATTTTTAVTRPKAKWLVIQEQKKASTPITSSKDKGKGIMVEECHTPPWQKCEV
ncbi:retrovirus-related pol polyprotein from transposon TNT 1-94 [Tanacetum coccineum]